LVGTEPGGVTGEEGDDAGFTPGEVVAPGEVVLPGVVPAVPTPVVLEGFTTPGPALVLPEVLSVPTPEVFELPAVPIVPGNAGVAAPIPGMKFVLPAPEPDDPPPNEFKELAPAGRLVDCRVAKPRSLVSSGNSAAGALGSGTVRSMMIWE